MPFDPIIGLQSCNTNHVQCRTCKYAEKGKICKTTCEKYPDGKLKAVYYYNIDCPKYEQGEDLIEYQAIKQIVRTDPYAVKEYDMTKTV